MGHLLYLPGHHYGERRCMGLCASSCMCDSIAEHWCEAKIALNTCLLEVMLSLLSLHINHVLQCSLKCELLVLLLLLLLLPLLLLLLLLTVVLPSLYCCGFVRKCALNVQVYSADWSDRQNLNNRFVSNNWVGALVLAGVMAGKLV